MEEFKITKKKNIYIIANRISQCKSKDEVIETLDRIIDKLGMERVSSEDRILFWRLVSDEINKIENNKLSGSEIQYTSFSLEDLVSFALQNIQLIIQAESQLVEKEEKV